MLVSVSFQWRLRRCKSVTCTHPNVSEQTFRSDALKDLYNILGETMYRDRLGVHALWQCCSQAATNSGHSQGQVGLPLRG